MKVNELKTLELKLTRPSETTPVWNVSDTSLITLKVDDGGHSAEVTALKEGVTTVNVSCNCDFGSGTRQHNEVFEIVIDGGEEVIDKPVSIPPPLPYWKSED